MMTLRFGIITCPTVQSTQMTTLLLLVQIDASGMFMQWQRHLAIENAFKHHGSAMLCCTTLLKCCMHNTYSSTTCLWGRTWNDLRWRSVYRNPPRSFPLLFPLLSCRKHALNCHRMKPALFSVLCEIKEKTGEFLLHSFSLCSPVCTGCNLLLTYSVSLLQFPRHQVTFLQASQRNLLIGYWLYLLWNWFNRMYCVCFGSRSF